eukprot:TRINITY_DN115_c0_g1_i2.p1 TRINITY_DN115_c0_g1~~TRINITY_DN115_c0_g1_i2.p1  ORF type:complete len:323 (+),score=9.22 TRINITY_DN115_c0_g1_i2:135-1103(+)
MNTIFKRCAICFEDITLSAQSVLACGCSYCQSCLTEFFISKTKDLSFVDEQKFKCPSDCGQVAIDPAVALELITDFNSKESLSEALLKVYIRNSSDIRTCPGLGCNYSGLLPKSSCHSSLQCESCKTEWRDESLYYPFESTIRKLMDTPNLLNHLLSFIYRDTMTEECPKCSIGISKNGGCPHMTCTKCRYEFCWNCKHRHHGHDQILCEVTGRVKYILLLIFAWAILAQTHTLQILGSAILSLVGFFIQILIFNAFFSFSVAMISAGFYRFLMAVVFHGTMALILGGGILYYGLFEPCAHTFLIELSAIGIGFCFKQLTNH